MMPEGLRSQQAYLPALETLRGLAIVMVVLFHYHGILGWPRTPDAGIGMRLLAAGNTGVTLFFVLSGFLLARPFLTALQGGRPVSIGRFYRARALRILPAYLAIVTIAWLVTKKTVLWKALLFIPLGYEAFPFALPWWSLCTEVQFYAILPWIMLLPRTRTGGCILAVLVVAWLGLSAWCGIGLDWPPPVRVLKNSVFGRGTGFLAGVLLAWFVASPSHARFTSRRLAGPVFAVCSALLAGLLIWYGGQPKESALAAFPLFHDLEAALWAGVMLGCLNGTDRWLPAPLRTALDATAVISYSLYLVHVPIQFYLLYPALHGEATGSRTATLAALVAASAALSWLAAWLGYRFVETPFLRRKAALRP